MIGVIANLKIKSGKEKQFEEIAKKFAKEGNKVYFTYLRSKKSYFNKLSYFQSKNVIPIKCDMRDPKQIKSLTKNAIEI